MIVGNTNTEATTNSFTKGNIFACPVSGGPTSGATLSSISMYTLAPHNGDTLQLAVYDSSFNLVGSTADITPSSTTPGWVSASASGTLADPHGNYYICWNGNTAFTSASGAYWNVTGGVSSNLYSVAQTYNTWPSTITPAITFNNRKVSIYFTCTGTGIGDADTPYNHVIVGDGMSRSEVAN